MGCRVKPGNDVERFSRTTWPSIEATRYLSVEIAP